LLQTERGSSQFFVEQITLVQRPDRLKKIENVFVYIGSFRGITRRSIPFRVSIRLFFRSARPWLGALPLMFSSTLRMELAAPSLSGKAS